MSSHNDTLPRMTPIDHVTWDDETGPFTLTGRAGAWVVTHENVEDGTHRFEFDTIPQVLAFLDGCGVNRG